VLNLALNAQDAMLSGGRLTLSTDVISLDGHESDPHPEISAGEHVLIAVTDNGLASARSIVLTKPYRKAELARRVREALATGATAS
jgi:hypothetical protein